MKFKREIHLTVAQENRTQQTLPRKLTVMRAMCCYFMSGSSPVTVSLQFLFELETGLVPEPGSVGPAPEQPAAAVASEAGSEQG